MQRVISYAVTRSHFAFLEAPFRVNRLTKQWVDFLISVEPVATHRPFLDRVRLHPIESPVDLTRFSLHWVLLDILQLPYVEWWECYKFWLYRSPIWLVWGSGKPEFPIFLDFPSGILPPSIPGVNRMSIDIHIPNSLPRELGFPDRDIQQLQNMQSIVWLFERPLNSGRQFECDRLDWRSNRSHNSSYWQFQKFFRTCLLLKLLWIIIAPVGNGLRIFARPESENRQPVELDRAKSDTPPPHHQPHSLQVRPPGKTYTSRSREQQIPRAKHATNPSPPLLGFLRTPPPRFLNRTGCQYMRRAWVLLGFGRVTCATVPP